VNLVIWSFDHLAFARVVDELPLRDLAILNLIINDR
jgi:hypothetical protein